MSLHKLTAGSGYDYLTRQVAALDATDKGRTGLATLNHPGFGGGIDPTKGWSHVSTEEVSA
jgi:hypothetical protein